MVEKINKLAGAGAVVGLQAVREQWSENCEKRWGWRKWRNQTKSGASGSDGNIDSGYTRALH